MSKEDAPTLVWFRKDLRLRDNSALRAAVEVGAPVIPVFIWAPEEAGDWSPGAASKWWLHQSLRALGNDLSAMGGKLVLGQGGSLATLRDLVHRSGARRVFWNRRYEGPLREIDASVKRALKEDGVDVRSFNSSLLNEPHTVSTGSDRPYKVFTPYWKNVRSRKVEAPQDPDFGALQFPKRFPKSIPLERLNLLPVTQWYRKFETYWQPGEAGAQAALEQFLGTPVSAYEEERDRPDHEGTSRLSPHLHWGEIGPRQVAAHLRERHDLRAKGPNTFMQEIYWREFAYNVLYHFPETPDHPLRPEFQSFPWSNDPAALKRWERGHTGFPIVDAGMRQLYEEGWMHNRVRMIVSSLLVKHLLQHWREGARWFWDTLVDADLASNTLGWQWSGGCGADAAPYFRIFNPMTQGKKFDPQGAYVKRYVPELERLDSRYVHEPWEAPDAVLDAAGLRLGDDYPEPIIEHRKGRARALEAFEAFKG